MEVFTGIRNGCEATAGLAKGIKGIFTTVSLLQRTTLGVESLIKSHRGLCGDNRHGLCNTKKVAFGIIFATSLVRVRPKLTVPKL
jgi:hypothetical protein